MGSSVLDADLIAATKIISPQYKQRILNCIQRWTETSQDIQALLADIDADLKQQVQA